MCDTILCSKHATNSVGTLAYTECHFICQYINIQFTTVCGTTAKFLFSFGYFFFANMDEIIFINVKLNGVCRLIDLKKEEYNNGEKICEKSK